MCFCNPNKRRKCHFQEHSKAAFINNGNFQHTNVAFIYTLRERCVITDLNNELFPSSKGVMQKQTFQL